MHKSKSSVFGLLGVLTLIAIVTVIPYMGYADSGTASAAPTSQTQNVNVVNSPTVNAQQSGPWNVGINGTVSVSNFPATTNVGIDPAANTVKIDATNPLPVRDVDNPDQQPFHANAIGGFVNGGSSSGFDAIATVPAGKRLIIEYVSVSGRMLPGQRMLEVGLSTTLQNSNNGSFNNQILLVSPQGSNGFRDVFGASQQLRLYADAGTTVNCFASRDTTIGGNPSSINYAISGYFVDVP